MSGGVCPHKEFVARGCDEGFFKCCHCGKFQRVIDRMPNMNGLAMSCTCRGSKSWFICLSCNRKFNRESKFKDHYKKAHTTTIDAAQQVVVPADDGLMMEADDDDHGGNDIMEDDDDDDVEYLSHENVWIQKGHINTTEKIPENISSSHSTPIRPKNSSTIWLAKKLKDKPKATVTQVTQCFPTEGLTNMRNFFCGEHAIGEGFTGGGIQYLVGQAFSGALDSNSIPSLEEAKWHIINFIQYNSMTEKQRIRQAQLSQSLMPPGSTTNSSFLKKTRNPSYKELAKYYGTGAGSILNLLPIPPVYAIGDIAYVNPVDIIRFIFANGLDIEKIGVQDSKFLSEPSKKVVAVADTPVVGELAKKAIKAHTDNFAVIAWSCDWRDGFSPANTKSNRKSVVTWTFTVSPPPSRVNSTDNTFPIATGLKKSSHWSQVEHRFRNDTSDYFADNKPLQVYHGALKKIIPVFVERIVSLEDRPERAEVTQTIQYNSNYHRCFGKVIRIDPPKFASDDVKLYLNSQVGDVFCFGWSHQFCNPPKRPFTDNNGNNNSGPLGLITNGNLLPACKNCRLSRLQTHIKSFSQQSISQQSIGSTPCTGCANWNLDHDIMQFPAEAKYPRTEMEECPVRPPAGREVGLKSLRMVILSFDILKKACKFALANAISKHWGKGTFQCYLKSCGINQITQDKLWRIAEEHISNPAGNNINWGSDTGIGSFSFPAAWVGPLPLAGYLETVMHQIFLGLAKSNFTLIINWATYTNNGSPFKRNTEMLLGALKGFNLSWLMTHEFSTGTGKEKNEKKTNVAGTGGWVSENWVAWTRVSKVTSGWCKSAQISGFEDVIRATIAFSCLTSRLMAHTGTDENAIQEIDVFIKEFMSCILDLDTQVQHRVAKPPPGGKADPKAKKRKKKSSRKEEESSHQVAPATQATMEEDSSLLVAPATPAAIKDAIKAGNSKAVRREPWWVKSNYLSLFNLVEMIRQYGPIFNWWDGGGKGERFIQILKPLIPRGLRQGLVQFFVTVTKKVYNQSMISYLENSLGLQGDAGQAMVEDDEEWIDYYLDEEGNMQKMEEDEEEEDNGEDQEQEEEGEADYSKLEDIQMSKTRTYFIYPNRAQIDKALKSQRPLSGIIVSEKLEGQPKALSLYLVYNKPGKVFGWMRVCFDDQNGEKFCGLWYAPATLQEPLKDPPRVKSEITSLAKMAAVMIPKRYALDGTKVVEENAYHEAQYCVVTNWWKERGQSGHYQLPVLDPSFYDDEEDNNNFLSGDNFTAGKEDMVFGEI